MIFHSISLWNFFFLLNSSVWDHLSVYPVFSIFDWIFHQSYLLILTVSSESFRWFFPPHHFPQICHVDVISYLYSLHSYSPYLDSYLLIFLSQSFLFPITLNNCSFFNLWVIHKTLYLISPFPICNITFWWGVITRKLGNSWDLGMGYFIKVTCVSFLIWFERPNITLRRETTELITFPIIRRMWKLKRIWGLNIWKSHRTLVHYWQLEY